MVPRELIGARCWPKILSFKIFIKAKCIKMIVSYVIFCRVKTGLNLFSCSCRVCMQLSFVTLPSCIKVLLKIPTPSCSSSPKAKMDPYGIAGIVFFGVAIVAVFCFALYRMLYYNIGGTRKIRPGFGSDDTIDLERRLRRGDR